MIMARKTSKGTKRSSGGGGGFFSKFLTHQCRPRRPEDTGAVLAIVSTTSQTAAASRITVTDNYEDDPPPNKQHQPPQQEVIAEELQQKTKTKKKKSGLSALNLSKAFDAAAAAASSNDDAATVPNSPSPAKSPPSIKEPYVFSNTRPAQENVRSKMRRLEQAFASKYRKEDYTTTTTTTTSSSISTTQADVQYVFQSPSGDEPVVDTQGDPWEHAYVVWYRKGLLAWRPKCVPAVVEKKNEEEVTPLKSNHDDEQSKMSDSQQKQALSHRVDVKALSEVTNSRTVHEEEKKNNDDDDFVKPSAMTRKAHHQVDDRIAQLISSRNLSLQKSRNAPIVSLFVGSMM